MTHNDQKIKEIAEKIQHEYGASGLSDGLYFDFSSAVAKEYAEYIILHEFQEYQRQVREMVGKKTKQYIACADFETGPKQLAGQEGYNQALDDILSHPLLNNK